MVCRSVFVSFALELGISFFSKKNLFKIAIYGLLRSEERKWRQSLCSCMFSSSGPDLAARTVFVFFVFLVLIGVLTYFLLG